MARHRAMSTHELVGELLDEDILEAGRCKHLLAERMAAAGTDDIVCFIVRTMDC